MTLPGGTVTFPFLDIEGSTGLLERIGTDYPQLFATLAEARRAGGEMTPQDAIAYALQPHHELAVAG